MNVYKIPETLYEKYHGSGYALAAVLDGAVIDIKYFEDIADEFYIDSDEFDGAYAAKQRIQEIITDSRLGETVRYFQSLGAVSVGMLSCYEFCEL